MVLRKEPNEREIAVVIGYFDKKIRQAKAVLQREREVVYDELPREELICRALRPYMGLNPLDVEPGIKEAYKKLSEIIDETSDYRTLMIKFDGEYRSFEDIYKGYLKKNEDIVASEGEIQRAMKIVDAWKQEN
jgi:hypothetical protein